jgi:uncharacterized membrane protein YwzB
MHFLIGLHAVLGEVGALAFLWVLVEIIDPNERRLRRAKIAATIGVICIFAAWFAGGYHYLHDYASIVKPVIKSGPTPWAHSVIMEMKEHIFLFLPLLTVLGWSLVQRNINDFLKNDAFRKSTVVVSLLIVMLAFSLAGMGFLISSGFRSALESNIL